MKSVATASASNITAPTQFIETPLETYAYRRFGGAAFRAWEKVEGDRFHKLRNITQPCLIVNGVLDAMIPIHNSYALAEHIPNAVLLTYSDAGHGSLFQYHESFVQHASLFLDAIAKPSINTIVQ